MRFQSLPRRGLCASLAVAAVLIFGTTATSRGSVPTFELAEATEIIDECHLAEATLEAMKPVSVPVDSAYRDALHAGQAHVVQAYHRSLTASWPSDPPPIRRRLDTALVTTINKLVKLDKSTPDMTRNEIRTALDREVARIRVAVVMLAGISPAVAPVPAPAPPPPAPVSTVPDVVAGAGFTGPTAQPATVGSGPGADAKAIARWDVVPFQSLTAKTPLGVVAFHINGIDRVEFSANGGPWVATKTMTLNSVTNAWEYCASFDPTSAPDGRVEVRAVVYPKAGVPRVLGGLCNSQATANLGEYSMVVFANSHDTLAKPVRYADSANGSDTTGDGTDAKPFASVYHALQDIQNAAPAEDPNALNGATIYLKAGQYSWGGGVRPYPLNFERWATIMPAPGVSRDSVVFTNGDGWGLFATFIHVQNCTMNGNFEVATTPNTGSQFLWLDNCSLTGPGRGTSVTPFRGMHWVGTFATDSSMRSYANGAIVCTLARNIRLADIGSDGYTDTRMIVNCALDGVDSTGTDNHADMYQLFDTDGSMRMDNLIVYGLRTVNAESQGIFVSNLNFVKDMAIVNVLFARPVTTNPTDPPFSQWGPAGDHILMWGVSLPNSTMFWLTDQMTNVSVKGCVFGKMMNNQAITLPDSWFESDHYVDVVSWPYTSKGSDKSWGDAGFVDPAHNDFTPAPGSALRNRVKNSLLLIDVDGNARPSVDTIGAIK